MSREYTISGGGLTVAGVTTLVAIRPAANCALEILRMWVNQSATATSAQQRIQWGRETFSVAPTFTSATPQKMKEGDPISQIVGGATQAVGTAGINASAEGTSSKSPIGHDSFNNVGGFVWLPTPDETIVLSPSGSSFYLFFPTAPGSLTLWDFGVAYREIG